MIGDNIRYYRKLNKMSQEEVAKKVGLSRVAITSWENNRTKPDSGHLDMLANIFGVEKTDLLGTEYLTEREAQLLQAFRRADEDTKDIVLRLLKYVERV
jgi:transcriptional regulator with XRE-family HTH domain